MTEAQEARIWKIMDHVVKGVLTLIMLLLVVWVLRNLTSPTFAPVGPYRTTPALGGVITPPAGWKLVGWNYASGSFVCVDSNGLQYRICYPSLDER